MPEYPNLEPNHGVRVDEDGYQMVACPFVNPETGEGFSTSWSPNAEPWEVNCLFCEWAGGSYPLSPEHGPDDATTPPPANPDAR